MEVMETLAGEGKEKADWAKEVSDAETADKVEPKAEPEVKAEPEPLMTADDLAEKPAEQPKPEPEVKEEAEQPRMVPLQALQAERHQRREIERQAAEMRQWYERQNAPPEADPTVQPIEALQQTREQLRAMQDQQNQFFADQQARNDEMQMIGGYANAAKQFTEKTTDFPDAYKHVIETRKQELIEQGFEDQAIVQMLRNEELGLVSNAWQNGQNPAQVIYKMAKVRGYTAKKAPDPVVKIEQQQAKAAAATSISPGGKPPKPEFSAADVASLQGASFDSAWAKMEAQARGKTASLFRK